MIAGGGAGLAVLVIAWFLFRGDTGRLGMIFLVMAGSALGLAATMWAVAVDLAGMLAQVAASIGGM